MIENLKYNKKFKNFFKNIYIYIISLFSAVIIFLTAFKTIETRNKESINIIDYYVLLFLSLNWLIYGILVERNAIIFLSLLLIMGSGLYIYIYHTL